MISISCAWLNVDIRQRRTFGWHAKPHPVSLLSHSYLAASLHPPLSVHPKHRLENISRLVEEVSRIERQFKGAVKLTVPWYSEAQLMVSPILKQAHVVTKAEFFLR